MIFLRLVVLIGLFIVSLSARDDLKKVTLQLNWKFQFEFAGFIAAYEKGFYKESGFDVRLKELRRGMNVIDEVKGARATFGIYDSAIFKGFDNKTPIVILANYLKRSPLVFVTRQDIFTPEDLKGKKIMAVKEELKDSSLSELLEKFSVKESDYRFYPHSFSADEFIDGKVDAMSAFISNQLYYLKKRNIPYNIIDPINYEIYGFGMNLFTTMKNVKKDSKRVRAFINATNRGWKYALDNKEELVDIIYNKYSKAKEKEALMYEAEQIDKLIMRDVYPIGSIKDSFILDKFNYEKLKGNIDKELDLDDIVFNSNRYFINDIDLNSKEQEYLKDKKEISLCIDPNWMPFEKLEDGKYIGISKEFFDIFEKVLNIPINLVESSSWSESIAFLKDKKCEVLSLVMQTKQREEFLNVTKPYLNVPLVIATRNDTIYINRVEDVINKERIGVVKSYSHLDIFKDRFPNNRLVFVESIDDGLEKVASGELFGFIDNFISVGYEIQRGYIGELKIAGKFKDEHALGVGVSKDDETLFNIFEKVVLALNESRKQEILNKWVNIKYEKSFDYLLLFKIVIVFVIILLIIFYRYKMVLKYSKKIKKQQKELQEKNRELNIEQKRLAESVGNFEILLDSIMEGVLIFKKHKCVGINKRGCELLGYSSKYDVLGKTLYKHLDKENAKTLKRKLHKNYDSYEIELIKQDGSTFPALIRDTFIKQDGKDLKLVTIIDLSEVKNKDKIFLNQSKLASMGEMINNIAHQWRQPLSLISTISTGLKMKIESEIDDKEESIEYLSKLNETSQYLSQTIDDFRSFFKSDKKRVEFCVDEVFRHNINLLEALFKSNYIKVITAIDNTIFLETYKNELIQAILNILNNSCDALKKIEGDRYIFVDVFNSKDGVCIRIRDNAGGIPKEIINKIFEPYFTTKHEKEGTGIGLYMTYEIINKHMRSSIEVNNVRFEYNDKILNGAEFKIFLDRSNLI